MRRCIFVILISLSLGAAANIGVAFACSYWSRPRVFQVGSGYAAEDGDTQWSIDAAKPADGSADVPPPIFATPSGSLRPEWQEQIGLTRSVLLPARAGYIENDTVWAARGLGVRWFCVYRFDSPPRRRDVESSITYEPQFDAFMQREFGWPWPAFARDEFLRGPNAPIDLVALFARRHLERGLHQPISVNFWEDSETIIRRPNAIRWPGFIANSIVYAVLAFLFINGLLFAHRRSRRLRGRCPRCAYDLRAEFANGCPECGWNRAQDESSKLDGSGAHPT